MDKPSMDKSNLFRKIIMTLLTVLVIVYVVYVIGRASFTQVRTESAKQMTVHNAISSHGYIIKDETLVNYKGSETLTYALDDGDKISKGETIATAFKNTDAANTNLEITHLNNQITALEQLQKSANEIAETPDAIDEHIDSDLAEVNVALANGNLSLVRSTMDSVLYSINQRQLVTGKLSGIDDRIQQLKKQVSDLKKQYADAQKGKQIKSNSTGYFVSSADGYEGVIKTDQLETLTANDLKEENLKSNSVDSTVIGKTINGVYWYIACPVSSEEALKIKNANSLYVEIPLVSNNKIAVDVYSINQDNKMSDAVAILRGSYMNSEMANIRSEDISIILNTYTGIYVPKSAVHEATINKTSDSSNGKTESRTVNGVYIKVGTEIEFKQIVPLYSGDDYIICDPSPDSEKIYSDSVGSLRLYDEIVVEGANLYDGKIINSTS